MIFDSALVSTVVKTFTTVHLLNFSKESRLVEHGAVLMSFTGTYNNLTSIVRNFLLYDVFLK